MSTTTDFAEETLIILRSVYGKVGGKVIINPCLDPKTGRFPDGVKKINAAGDMILSLEEISSKKYFIPENEKIEIEDGTTFDLTDEIQRTRWEAIKNCSIIAPDRFAKDSKGNLLIDGEMGRSAKPRRYGVAQFYIEKPGFMARISVSKKKLRNKAENYIFTDDKGAQGRLLKTKLLGQHMDRMADSDITDYLLLVAAKEPQKIINLYEDKDTAYRLLLIDAKNANFIYVKNRVYMYADNIVLGATDDAAVTWLMDSKNASIVDLIRKQTYPNLEELINSNIKDVKKDTKKEK